jgi:hypothetical protein
MAMAYDTGYAAACMEHKDPRYEGFEATHAANIELRNQIRDALEADMADLIDRAQTLADKARTYSGCDLFDQADALDAAVEKMLG